MPEWLYSLFILDVVLSILFVLISVRLVMDNDISRREHPYLRIFLILNLCFPPLSLITAPLALLFFIGYGLRNLLRWSYKEISACLGSIEEIKKEKQQSTNEALREQVAILEKELQHQNEEYEAAAREVENLLKRQRDRQVS